MKRAHLPLVTAGLAFALNLAAQESPRIQFKGAQAFTEFGNIVKGVELSADTLDNMWVQRFGGTFDLQASNGGNLDIYFGIGSIFWHAIPAIGNQSASKVFYGDAILTKAFAQFHFGEDIGDGENPLIVGKLGFFPVKYSPAKNLGEYLFRTGTYPSFLVTGNGYTAVNTVNKGSTQVLGTQWTHHLSPSFSHELFFTSERQSYPLHDFSLSYLARFKSPFLNAGIGLQLDRLIPVTPSLTTPNEEKNTWFTYQGVKYVNNPEYYHELSKGALHDSNPTEAAFWSSRKALIDSLRAAWDSIPASRPKLEKYTFKGIKPLAMMSLDFKALFDSPIFRNDELLLYSEAVLMGWEDQPIYYENRMDRLAVMVGVNLPTFGLLDHFNIEVERLTAKFVNGYRTAREGNLPLPDYNYDPINGYDPDDWSKDDIKWSVFMQRAIFDGFSIQFQAASDHLRGRRYTRVVSENSLLVDDSHWYYFIKLQASL